MKCEVFGGLVPGHVPDALLRVREFVPESSVAVVRCIDSGWSQENLSRALSFHRVPYDIVQGNIRLSMENLWKTVDEEVFPGFDEVWICSGEFPVPNLTHMPPATSDGTDFRDGLPEEVEGMIESGLCLLVLGDGCGLNYATSDDRIARAISECADP